MSDKLTEKYLKAIALLTKQYEIDSGLTVKTITRKKNGISPYPYICLEHETEEFSYDLIEKDR